MSKLKVKPFTFFLVCLSLLFLIFFPKLFREKIKEPEEDPFVKELPEWSGIITIWDVPFIETGKGNHIRWLNSYISKFEKKYPGVFIDVRTMSYERMVMYFHGGQNNSIMPDIISLGVYDQPVKENLLTDLLPYFLPEELENLREPALQRAMSDGRMYAVPWMMGCYGLFINKDTLMASGYESIPEELDITVLDEMARKMSYQKKTGKKTISHYGFITYCNSSSRPLLSMILPQDGKIKNAGSYRLFQGWANDQVIFPPEIASMTYTQAFRLLAIDNRAGIMLGNSKVLFDLRRLQETGKSVNYKVYTLPLEGDSGFYLDQIAAYGLIKQDNKDKEQLCILFLKGLLSQETQIKLDELGMFPVLNNIQLYADDSEMGMIEKSLESVVSTPFSDDRIAAENVWESLTGQLGTAID